MPRYYDLRDDRRHPGRWHLGGPSDARGQELNPWQFFKGRHLEFESSPRLPLDVAGHPLDFSWAAFGIPVVSVRFVQLFERLHIPDVQFLPVQVENHPGPWFILNTLRTVRCIDDARCAEVRYFTSEDNQPEKLGQYRVVSGLRIDPEKAGNTPIFRPWGWSIALLVSEPLKLALEHEHLTGLRFTGV